MKRILLAIVLLLAVCTSVFAQQQEVVFSWDLNERFAPRGNYRASSPDSTFRLPTVEEAKIFVKYLYRGPEGKVRGVPVRFLTSKEEYDYDNNRWFYTINVDGTVKKISRTAPVWILWVKDTQK